MIWTDLETNHDAEIRLISEQLFFVHAVLAEQTKGIPLMVTFAIAGFLRGVMLVNLNLSISEYVSLKKLPSAFGIFMVLKGLLVVTMSPLIGTFG